MNPDQPPPQIKTTLAQFIKNLQNSDPQSCPDQDAIIQKYILSQILPFIGPEESVFNIVKEMLTNTQLQSPRKYIVLMYLSLVEITRDKVSDLFKFFYQLTSEALKQLKQRYSKQHPHFWEVLFQKIYQYGMLLLVGSKSLLLNVQSLGMRVNTQMLSDKAKQMRLSRLVKIYNALLCIPQKYLTLKQTLYLTLIFTRWELNQSDYSTPSFFGQFITKTHKKLIRKIKSYPTQVFNQEHILNLIKIVLGGDELIFSFFLQIKYSYEAIKINSNCFFKTESGVFEAMRKCPVERESRHLFNFIIELLMNFRPEQAVTTLERQSIMYVCLKFLSGKYDNNESLFITLSKGILHEQNEVISQISFRFIAEQALQYLTVHKVKILLNLFNNQNWQKLLKNSQIHGSVILNRLQRVIALLVSMARRYSQTALVVQCSQNNYGIHIKNAKNVKSIIVVVCFEGVGLLNESGRSNMQVIRVYLNKSIFYQVSITFAEVVQSSITEGSQSKERAAFLTISNNKKELLRQRKQYLKYGEGCFQSLISFSIAGKQHKSIAFCIDGAYYEIDIKQKSQIVGIQVGNMKGSIRSFYALKTQIDQVTLHKVWCEWDRKVNFVVDTLGTQHVAYKLNTRLDPVIVDMNTSTGFTLFQSKTEFKLGGVAVKNITFIDVLLQLGGLETIFFIMQRFSQSLLYFKECEEKINIVLADFFSFLRVSAILDETMLFLDDILNCFQYLNQFLFLLVKRNKMVRDSQSSALLLSIFELLIQFRKERFKSRSIPINLKYKMAEIEVSVVLKILTNFQIWSNCTVSLQQFVLSQIELFIHEQTYIATFIIKDLHKELLANVMLFSHHPHIHYKLIELCNLLYDKSKAYIKQPLDLKQIAEENSLHYEPFIERDSKICLSLIQAIINNKQDRHFLQAEQNTFRTLIKYFIDNFICNTDIFNKLQKVWNPIAFTFCNIIKQLDYWNRHIAQNCLLVIINQTNKEENLDVWIVRCFDNIIDHPFSTFIDCFYLFCFMVHGYQFDSPKKCSIFDTILKGLISKLLLQTKQSLHEALALKQIMRTLTPNNLYYLTTYRQFQQLFIQLKSAVFGECYDMTLAVPNQSQNNNQPIEQKKMGEDCSLPSIDSQQKLTIWVQINQNIIHSLYRQNKINNLNKNFAKMAIIHSYQGQTQHKLAQDSPKQLLLSIEQVKQLAKITFSTQQSKYNQLGLASALALIEHCKCWPVLYFLLQNRLITTDYDLSIPLDPKTIPSSGLMGGTLGYYLSSACSAVQLYALFTTILYKQLSNNVSLLTTQSEIVIFQYCIEYLFQKSRDIQTGSQQTYNIQILLLLLKQMVKSLNLRFIIRVCSIHKDLQKLLGKVNTKKHYNDYKTIKKEELLQNLVKAANKIQIALEEDKVDRDISQFIQNILDKLTLIQNYQQEEPKALQQMAVLVGDVTTKQQIYSETQLRKLGLIGIRFFQIARDFNLAKYHEAIFINSKHNKSEDKLPALSPKDAELSHTYVSQLTQKFDSILLSLSLRGQESEQKWDNLVITNEHWFELQEDVDDVTTKFYQVDQKQIGPHGFYRLNIRPVKTDHQKLPYPRRKEYQEMMTKKKQEKEEPSFFMSRLTIENVGSNLYSKLSESTNLKEKSFRSRESTLQAQNKNNSTQNKYYCELITKRGAYAGTLSRHKTIIEFNYIGHDNLPSERVYQLSTKCHRIESLLQWQEKELKNMKMLLKNCKIFTRRYILRHTAIEITDLTKHRTYFFNLFEKHTRSALLSDLKNSLAEIIEDRVEAFKKAEFTDKWRRAEISNFEYLSFVNQYSGRTFNDLAQYPVMPWVITNYDGEHNFNQINRQFYKAPSNLRDLSLPAGKLNHSKFQKLKSRLQQVHIEEKQIRFLYGSMYSNPTVLYNFFIRLQPFTSLHWQHQGRRIDHADRLFSGIAENFSTVITSSSDNKELAPQFYYWTEFLKNRNKIQLGRRQRGDEVDAVVLPPWARSPEQFVFKMREVLQSKQISAHLHEWIDLIFGQKAPYSVAEKYDNLYHYQCYEHDLFEQYQTDSEMKIAQIAISEFGQIPEQLFKDKHPPRNKIKDTIDIDTGILIHKGSRIQGFQHNDVGILLWSDEQVVLKKIAVAGLFHSFEWTREYASHGKNYFLESIMHSRWITVGSGLLRLVERGKDKIEKLIQAKCMDAIGTYCLFGCGSKLAILRFTQQFFQRVCVLYGHRDQIILIKTDQTLDVIISVDRSGLVLIHELTELRFLRAFELGTDFEGEQSEQLRLCVHQMGYYIFLDHNQTIWIFNFMGELILEQEFEVKATKSEEERITDIELLSHQHSIILMASSRGNIFQVNFLEVIRFRDVYPFKTYSRLDNNMLAAMRGKKIQNFAGKAIRQLRVIKCSLQTGVICQLLVLYETGEVVCYTEQKQLGKQLQSDDRLKSMGFF